jgi:hypothetical protein
MNKLDDRKLLRQLADSCQRPAETAAHAILMAALAYLIVGGAQHRFLSRASAHRYFWGQPGC